MANKAVQLSKFFKTRKKTAEEGAREEVIEEIEKEKKIDWKDTGILAAWIGGMLLVGGLLWFLAVPLQERRLIAAANHAVETAAKGRKELRRLEAPIKARELPPRKARVGSWFTVRPGKGEAVIFSVAAQGIFLPCLVLVDPAGKAEAPIPLSVHAERMLRRLPAEELAIYIRRVENAWGGTP